MQPRGFIITNSLFHPEMASPGRGPEPTLQVQGLSLSLSGQVRANTSAIRNHRPNLNQNPTL